MSCRVKERSGTGLRVGDPPPRELGPWADRWTDPPPDIIIDTSPPGARGRTAEQIAAHVRGELERGRSLYCIVHDSYIRARIGGFDGRALPSRVPEGLNAEQDEKTHAG